jgi:hypothetical protein
MSRMPRASTGPQPPPVQFLNLVPTRATRQLAERMIFDANKDNGADSVMANIADLDASQTAALIGVLLEATTPRRKVGRPIIALVLTPAQRREAHRLYMQGDRDPWVLEGQREYQRANQRSLRARGGVA